jgi:putative transposase
VFGLGCDCDESNVSVSTSTPGPAAASPTWRRARPDPLATDLLGPTLRPGGMDQLWGTDITEYSAWDGMVDCAVVLDVCSRRVVGWPIGS